MSNIFFWLNDNSGFLTFLTVLASLITCILSLCSARAAWAQVKEMRRQFQEENRPNIEVEFLYERRAFYGLRFINHGKYTAKNVRILLEDAFINALPESAFSSLLRKSSQKTCIIGVGQHYDLLERKSIENVLINRQQKVKSYIKLTGRHTRVNLILIWRTMPQFFRYKVNKKIY